MGLYSPSPATKIQPRLYTLVFYFTLALFFIIMFDMTEYIKKLFATADTKYRDFQSGLIPNLAADKFIGVRTPALRAIAKQMYRNGDYHYFLHNLPHKYFDENQLHAFILSNITDFDSALDELNRFLPYVDNWATCDQMSPVIFKKNSRELVAIIKQWIKSKHPFTVRFGILNLMRYFLDDNFDTKYSDWVAQIKSNDYYVNMMRAWYFATALAKQYDLILPYFTQKKLDTWTHNRAITKACESFRVPPAHKQELKNFKQ